MSAAALILLAWCIEVLLGWPDGLFKRIRHPVVWIGVLIANLDRILNRPEWSHQMRYVSGICASIFSIGLVTSVAFAVAVFLPNRWWGVAIEAVIASSLLASRSLYAHVAAISTPLSVGDLQAARQAVSMIVSRDPNKLAEAGIGRAGLESLAENASDGVIAPLFWGALLGLPGLAAYKTINTLDSMIGYRNNQYQAFGGFAARLDDLVNLVPARLTGLLITMGSLKSAALRTMLRDASKHRSPNAGWPEAAMAGGLGVRLSGPRSYDDRVREEPWLNTGAPDPTPEDMVLGLALYRRALVLAGVALAVIALGWAI
ncbi:MAG: adenosylcobinamide-phosphate synthase CbiB [Henriciella sp.]